MICSKNSKIPISNIYSNDKNDSQMKAVEKNPGSIEKFQPNSKSSKSSIYLIIPFLICASLLWFSYIQWQNPPKIEPFPEHLKEAADKEAKRIWWMPDFTKTLAPFVDGYRRERFLKSFNVTICTINGNFPEIIDAITCFITKPELYSINNATISKNLNSHEKFCGNQPPLTLPSYETWKTYLTNNERRLAIIQDPLERFVRQYHDICLNQKENCFECKNDLNCFMRRLYKNQLPLSEGIPTRTSILNYFSPQTWNCHFNWNLHQIETLKIGGNETNKIEFINQLNSVLEQQGVNEEIRENLKSEFLKIPMQLTADQQKLYNKIKNDGNLLKLFKYLYEHDYIVFNYK